MFVDQQAENGNQESLSQLDSNWEAKGVVQSSFIIKTVKYDLIF